MSDAPVPGRETTGSDRSGPDVSEPGRGRRLFSGWSANLFQTVLGVTQQVALVPVFLHYWTSDVLAAWLALYAAGNMVQIADAGLQFRAINRFLGFKSCTDQEGRTASYYAAMLRIYLGLAVALTAIVLVAAQFISPSAVLGFRGVAHFDAAFVVMISGMLLGLPANLASGLSRARGLYGRAVRLQSWSMLLAQLGQLAAITVTGSLLAVTSAYAVVQVLLMVYFLAIEAPRMMPGYPRAGARHSWRWIVGQYRRAAPFAVANATELALVNLPVLLVSALVTDRVVVAQWGLTRVAAGLIRMLCSQITLPLAAELGHDHAVGLKDRLRDLYARGSVLVTAFASLVVSGLLPFWPDFFALWTHGTVPYNPVLTAVLLIGTGTVAPSLLALGYANYSNQGDLLVRTKGLQLVAFLILSALLIPPLGPLGAAFAMVASDLSIQFGLLGTIIIRQTLERPLRHVALLAALMVLLTAAGWALGSAIRSLLPWTGLIGFLAECALWLVIVLAAASPLASARLRARLDRSLPK